VISYNVSGAPFLLLAVGEVACPRFRTSKRTRLLASYFVVCVGCFPSGVDHLRAWLRAEYHRRSAERCEAESTGPIELPSVELYRAMLESPVQASPALKQ